jgi:hypothetical protein
MQIRTHNKKGEPYPQKKLDKASPVLFGAYDWEVDKKMVVWEKVAEMEPQITWLYNKKGILKKENFDMSDSYIACLAKMRQNGIWV